MEVHRDQDHVASTVNTRLRASSAPLPEYLFSRSVAGVSHVDIIEGLDKASDGSVFARFFHFYPERQVDVQKWLTGWINRGNKRFWSLLEFRLKGTVHYWQLLKIIVGIKTYLVTSNGELLIV